MTEILTKTGLVALFDALGVRNHDVEQSRAYLQIINDSLVTYSPDNPKIENVRHFPRILSFGDSVLMLWEIDPNNSSEWTDILTDATAACAHFVDACLKQGFLMRGAMSIGSYVCSNDRNNTAVLGPVITDIASWHEQTDWFGCICTPKLSHWLNEKTLSDQIADDLPLILYPVPLRGGGEISLWCLAWTDGLIFESSPDSNDGVRALALFSKYCAGQYVPKGTENKYMNAVKFVAHCVNADKIAKTCLSKKVILECIYGFENKTSMSCKFSRSARGSESVT